MESSTHMQAFKKHSENARQTHISLSKWGYLCRCTAQRENARFASSQHNMLCRTHLLKIAFKSLYLVLQIRVWILRVIKRISKRCTAHWRSQHNTSVRLRFGLWATATPWFLSFLAKLQVWDGWHACQSILWYAEEFMVNWMRVLQRGFHLIQVTSGWTLSSTKLVHCYWDISPLYFMHKP